MNLKGQLEKFQEKQENKKLGNIELGAFRDFHMWIAFKKEVPPPF